MSAALVVAVLWLAYSNGANDNFKGVATLYGSHTASFRHARRWATLTTVAGSLLSLALAATLAERFTGSGLIPPELARMPAVLISVGTAAAATVLLATLLGMPTSTTHALTGALVGVALVAGRGSLPLGELWSSFFLPLLVSPILAVGLAAALYGVLKRLRVALGVGRETCLCIGRERVPVPVLVHAQNRLASALPRPRARASVALGPRVECVERYSGSVVGVSANAVVEKVHYASAGAVCFARAVNDTPKIAALLLVGDALAGWKLAVVAGAMALGGVLQSRRVAETMSKRITTLNPGQGLTGNLVTALLVIGASRLGVPVSTTHVSVGSIFGIGVAAGRTRWKTVRHIALTWLTTLPLGGLIGAASYALLT